MPTLELTGITKRFGGIVACNAVSLALEAGEVQALIGPNGAGKTTLINLITGRLTPDSGEIKLMGEDILALLPQQRVRKGLVRTFQITNLFPHFSAWENIALAVAERRGEGVALLPGRGFSAATIDETEAIAERIGLGPAAARIAGELSYGQQRILEMAMALALQPKVLLLDEPAAGLPSTEHHLIRNVVSGLGKDVAVLLIEHDMDLVFSLAQRVTVLNEGAILVSGAPDDIRRDERVKSAYLGGLVHG